MTIKIATDRVQASIAMLRDLVRIGYRIDYLAVERAIRDAVVIEGV